MRRIIVLSFLSTILLSMVAATLVVPKLNSSGREIRYFLLMDCALPCVAGAKLGYTKFDEIGQKFTHRLESMGFNLEGSPDTLRWTKRDKGAIEADFDNNILSRIVIEYDTMDTTVPTIADLMADYGPPSCVLHTRYFIDLYYLGKGYLVIASVDTLNFNQLIRVMLFVPSATPLDCQSLQTFDWRGFTNQYSH